ncbi:MAG: SRPBCC family protein [Acidimicrobiales bacterium]
MPQITVTQMVDAPADAVWRELADIAGHVDWMADAASIRFVGDQRAGVGTRFECVTRLGPLRTTDRMEVTAWHEGTEIAVRHAGLVQGEGRFTIRPPAPSDPDGETEVVWSERLTFPWYLGGPVTAVLLTPVLRLVWQGNLRRFADLVD